MTAEIVAIREGAPSLNDIPGMLRQMADQIEAGTHGEVNSVILLLPASGEYPRIFGWGDVDGGNHPALQCELAKMFLLTHIVVRHA